jgi:hypothetical protein
MISHHVRAIAFSAVFGLAAPYLWGYCIGLVALHMYEPIVRWTWLNFHIKGPIVYWVVTAFETLVIAAVFGAVLRIVSAAPWWQSAVAFSLAFVLSVLVEAAWSGESDLLLFIAPGAVALLVCTALMQAVLARRSTS